MGWAGAAGFVGWVGIGGFVVCMVAVV